MIEQIVAASPLIEEAFELGVDIRLGTAAWGLFQPGRESCGAADIRVGLENGERAWVVNCAHLVLATGSRDVMFGFKGWDQPGVMEAALQGLTAPWKNTTPAQARSSDPREWRDSMLFGADLEHGRARYRGSRRSPP